MIRYLGRIHVKPEDIESQAIFPSKNGERSQATELYIPHEDIRQLGLPILSWPGAIGTNDGIFCQIIYPHLQLTQF